ncbi:MAG TPA: MFS transporter, partial [Paracoccaceae bacterium]|nr:MFS transporter [Paracoccaceae bacterium]
MTASRLFTPVLIGGCIIVLASFGIRATFGLFQIPIASEFDWPRAEFSLAIAIQNLAWGIGAPLFGAFAERFGDRRAIVLGAAVYMAGLLLSTIATTPVEHQVLEFLVGMGVAGTGLGVILAVVGRAASDKHRSMALAIVTAAGSVGQILAPPITQALLARLHWGDVFVVFSLAILASLLFLPLL